jgi:hypothetical protein
MLMPMRRPVNEPGRGHGHSGEIVHRAALLRQHGGDGGHHLDGVIAPRTPGLLRRIPLSSYRAMLA